MGSPCFRIRGLYQVSGCATRICLCRSLHPWTWTTIATRRLPSCVSPSLDYYCTGSRAPLGPSPEGLVNKLQALSTSRFVEAVLRRVPESSTGCPSTTPVRPRLRSRAYQGRLTGRMEPLVIRRTGFSPVVRLMPAFSLVWPPRLDPPPLPWPHDAPLPINTLGPPTRRCGGGQCVNATASVVCLSPALHCRRGIT